MHSKCADSDADSDRDQGEKITIIDDQVGGVLKSDILALPPYCPYFCG